MTPTGRIAPPGEEGFALIEVLVSALILAIVAAGVMALLQATTRSAADERRHAEAYAIAQEDQARLRSMRLSALNRLEQTRPVSVDGNEFTVKSQGVFVNNTQGQPSSCTAGETSADYVRITSTTTWPGSRQPVVIQSIVSPSNGSLDPNHGTLVVTTKNAASEAAGRHRPLGHRRRDLQRHHRLHRLRQLRRPARRQLQRHPQRPRPGRQARRSRGGAAHQRDRRGQQHPAARIRLRGNAAGQIQIPGRQWPGIQSGDSRLGLRLQQR